MTNKDVEIAIKPLKDLDALQQIVSLQREYWGDDVESVVPAHMLFSLTQHGGHVLAAFDGNKVVGALIGFLGTSMDDPRRPAMANLHIASKRMIVLPQYRGAGIGYRLKLAQRDIAITQGVRLVTWTFDPLLALNAHLNIRKLGAMSPQFLPDYYGTIIGGNIVSNGSSDRLIAEWWVTNRRVEERLFGKRNDLTLEQYLLADTVILNPANFTDDGIPTPSDGLDKPRSSLALLEIPTNFASFASANEILAKTWRRHIRGAFQAIFSEGFVVTDFIRSTYDGRDRAFYGLSYNGPQFETFTVN